MPLFDRVKKLAISHRKTDEALYSAVAQEMALGIRHNGLWLKALEQADGNKERQVAEYIKLRVRSLRDDVVISSNSNSSESSVGRGHDIEDLITMLSNNASINTIERYFSGMSRQEMMIFVNTPDACDEYPIHVSIKKKRLDLAKWLIEAGADSQARNYWGKTPLEIAIRDENKEAIALLERYST